MLARPPSERWDSEMTTPTPPEWTYSGNPASSLRDEVRFLVQDTEESLPLISNAELDYLITYWMPRYESSYWVAAEAAQIISRKFAGMVSISADGVSVSVGDLSSKYSELSKSLRRSHQDALSVGGEVDLTNLMLGSELDTSIAPLNFAVGGMDNPWAGHQAIGGKQGSYADYDERPR